MANDIIVYDYLTVDEILEILTTNGICNWTKEEQLLSIIAVLNGSYIGIRPFFVRRKKGKEKMESTVFSRYYKGGEANVYNIDFENNTATLIERTKYKVKLNNIYVKLGRLYVNLNGTEIITTNNIDSSITRRKTSIDECIEIAKDIYSQYRKKKNKFTAEDIDYAVNKLKIYVKKRKDFVRYFQYEAYIPF